MISLPAQRQGYHEVNFVYLHVDLLLILLFVFQDALFALDLPFERWESLVQSPTRWVVRTGRGTGTPDSSPLGSLPLGACLDSPHPHDVSRVAVGNTLPP